LWRSRSRGFFAETFSAASAARIRTTGFSLERHAINSPNLPGCCKTSFTAACDRPIDLRSPPLSISANVSDHAIEGSGNGTKQQKFPELSLGLSVPLRNQFFEQPLREFTREPPPGPFRSCYALTRPACVLSRRKSGATTSTVRHISKRRERMRLPILCSRESSRAGMTSFPLGRRVASPSCAGLS
jgi:hypothetical protein